MAVNIEFSFPNTYGYTIRYSDNNGSSISLVNVENVGIEDPFRINGQYSAQEGIVIPYVTGVNAPLVFSITLNCPSQQIAEIGCAFDDIKRELPSDLKNVIGTLEIVNPNGDMTTYSDAILTTNPIHRTFDATSQNPTYVLTIESRGGIRS